MEESIYLGIMSELPSKTMKIFPGAEYIVADVHLNNLLTYRRSSSPARELEIIQGTYWGVKISRFPAD